MSKPIFYTNDISPHGNVVQAFLVAGGLLDQVDVQHKDFAKGEHKSPEVVAANPAGQLPALKDGDLGVFESHAIIRYLAIRFKSDLLPAHDVARWGQIDSAMEHLKQKVWDNSTKIVYHEIVAEKFGRKGDPERAKQGREGLKKTLSFVNDTFFKQSQWVVGDKVTGADVVLGTILDYVSQAGVEPEDEKVKAFLAAWRSQEWWPKTAYAKVVKK